MSDFTLLAHTVYKAVLEKRVVEEAEDELTHPAWVLSPSVEDPRTAQKGVVGVRCHRTPSQDRRMRKEAGGGQEEERQLDQSTFGVYVDAHFIFSTLTPDRKGLQ